jgi:glycerol kinase
MIQNSAQVEQLASSVDDNVEFTSSRPFQGYALKTMPGEIAGADSLSKGTLLAPFWRRPPRPGPRDVKQWRKNPMLLPIFLRVDGGMVANHLLMQFQADILNTPVVPQ